MSEVSLTAARDAIGQILQGMGVTHVVSVDDFYADDHYDKAVELLAEARSSPEIAQHIKSIPDDILHSQDGIWEVLFGHHWGTLSAENRISILDELGHITGASEFRSDMSTLSLLKNLMPSDIDFLALRPTEWQQQRAHVMAAAEEGKAVLCLFDQDLHLDGLPQNGGDTLLRSTLGSRGERPVICGLLTQWIGRNDELDKIRKYALVTGPGLDQFLLLSKDRLRGDPIEFADGLKTIWLYHVRERLTKELARIAERADTKANDDLNDMDIYDFDYAVLQTSETEGLWEPETLFRLFEILRLKSFRNTAFKDARPSLDKCVEQIRAVRDVATSDRARECPSQRVCQIRVAELYEDEAFLNTTNQPLGLGDIFLIGDAKYYVLLAQPCDLMVRPDREGSRAIHTATLARIKIGERGPSAKRSSVSRSQLEHFEHFLSQPTLAAYVSLIEAYQVSLDILDLAVFNRDGYCRFPPDINGQRLHEPWLLRFGKLNVKLKKELAHSAWHDTTQSPEYTKYVRQALTYRLLGVDNTGRFKVGFDCDAHGAFRFDIRRVGRYKQPGSVRLLNNYFAFRSRDAEAHDFAREKNAGDPSASVEPADTA